MTTVTQLLDAAHRGDRRAATSGFGYNGVPAAVPGGCHVRYDFEAVIENGQIRLPKDVVLPERQVVYVVVPDPADPAVRKLPGVRLADPADAPRFEMTVDWGDGP
jgi:hypothetical protein